jgi:hypothetical protein
LVIIPGKSSSLSSKLMCFSWASERKAKLSAAYVLSLLRFSVPYFGGMNMNFS